MLSLKSWRKAAELSFAALLALSSAASFAADKELSGVTLKICMYPIGEPSAYFEGDVRNLHGIDVDVVSELQKRLGFTLADNRIFPMHYSVAFDLMEHGRADMVGGGLSLTKERADRFDPSEIYYASYLSVMVSDKYNAAVRSLNDFKGKEIVADSSIISDDYAARSGFKRRDLKNLTLTVFDISEGRTAAVMYDYPQLKSFVNKVGSGKFRLLDEKFGEEYCQYVFYMTKNHPYKEVIDRTLREMVADGTMKSIQDKWLNK